MAKKGWRVLSMVPQSLEVGNESRSELIIVRPTELQLIGCWLPDGVGGEVLLCNYDLEVSVMCDGGVELAKLTYMNRYFRKNNQCKVSVKSNYPRTVILSAQIE